ncbi:MAG: hypothetical protein FRX49_09225 [Trebouxia sp. A1-2]|nr:MAG: hypothetical protein FRX49_09225 [Trebouxia sp. A1-2]
MAHTAGIALPTMGERPDPETCNLSLLTGAAAAKQQDKNSQVAPFIQQSGMDLRKGASSYVMSVLMEDKEDQEQRGCPEAGLTQGDIAREGKEAEEEQEEDVWEGQEEEVIWKKSIVKADEELLTCKPSAAALQLALLPCEPSQREGLPGWSRYSVWIFVGDSSSLICRELNCDGNGFKGPLTGRREGALLVPVIAFAADGEALLADGDGTSERALRTGAGFAFAAEEEVGALTGTCNRSPLSGDGSALCSAATGTRLLGLGVLTALPTLTGLVLLVPAPKAAVTAGVAL